MYKKITHNIVEEHFDHPATLPNGMLTAMNGTPMQASQPPIQTNFTAISGELPQYVMNDVTMLFRMDARTAWGKWVWSLLNYSISLNGDLPGTDQVKARLTKNAVALGEYIIPYYGLTSGNLLSTALINIGDVGVQYVEAFKAGKDTKEIEAKWPELIDKIATILNELNPNNWSKAILVDIFTNLVRSWTEQLQARAKKDVVADEIAIDYINKLVITGLPDHIKHGFSSLADIFSRGIISQFADMFAHN